MNIFRLTIQFAKELGEYIKKGAPNVNLQQYEDRLNTCKKCPHQVEDKCTLCGCIISIKAKWATTKCPDKPSRWQEIKKK